MDIPVLKYIANFTPVKFSEFVDFAGVATYTISGDPVPTGRIYVITQYSMRISSGACSAHSLRFVNDAPLLVVEVQSAPTPAVKSQMAHQGVLILSPTEYIQALFVVTTAPCRGFLNYSGISFKYGG